MKYEPLSYDDIEELHDVALERFGGLAGTRDPGCVKAIAEKPFRELLGHGEAYPGLFMKAAIYMEGLAVGHCFVDGNKRTGYLAAYTFLILNGRQIIVEDEELFNTAVAVAKKEMTAKQLAEWLKIHSTEL